MKSSTLIVRKSTAFQILLKEKCTVFSHEQCTFNSQVKTFLSLWVYKQSINKGCFHSCSSVHLVGNRGKNYTLSHFSCDLVNFHADFLKWTKRNKREVYTDWHVTGCLDSFGDGHPASLPHLQDPHEKFLLWWLTEVYVVLKCFCCVYLYSLVSQRTQKSWL